MGIGRQGLSMAVDSHVPSQLMSAAGHLNWAQCIVTVNALPWWQYWSNYNNCVHLAAKIKQFETAEDAVFNLIYISNLPKSFKVCKCSTLNFISSIKICPEKQYDIFI